MERAFTRVMPLLIMVSALHSVDLTWRIREFFFNCFHCKRQSVKKVAKIQWNAACKLVVISRCIYQIDSMLWCVSSVIDLRWLPTLSVGVSLTFLPHFDVFFDLLVNRCRAIWGLFVLYNKEVKKTVTSFMHLPFNR